MYVKVDSWFRNTEVEKNSDILSSFVTYSLLRDFVTDMVNSGINGDNHNNERQTGLCKQCIPWSDCSLAVRSGSTLFAILFASFERYTLWLSLLVQVLGWLQQIFLVSEFLGFSKIFRHLKKLQFKLFNFTIMCPKEADRIANSIDLVRVVWSESTCLGRPVCRKTYSQHIRSTLEPGHEKTCLMSYANNKGADQPAHPRSLIDAFVVRCLDSVMSLVSVTKVPSPLLASVASVASVAEQSSLSLTWSETPEDTFSHDKAHLHV